MWYRFLGIWCWFFGHRILSPGHWEFGWWSVRDEAWVNFKQCECQHCKKIVDPEGEDKFRWA